MTKSRSSSSFFSPIQTLQIPSFHALFRYNTRNNGEQFESSKLSIRGLSIAGIKLTLVKRLEAALRKEAKQFADGGVDGVSADDVKVEVGRKRERDDENGDGDENEEPDQKISAIEKIRGMTVKELRELATLRGVSSAGTKKQPIERRG